VLFPFETIVAHPGNHQKTACYAFVVSDVNNRGPSISLLIWQKHAKTT
jgi:hypothetical protein